MENAVRNGVHTGGDHPCDGDPGIGLPRGDYHCIVPECYCNEWQHEGRGCLLYDLSFTGTCFRWLYRHDIFMREYCRWRYVHAQQISIRIHHTTGVLESCNRESYYSSVYALYVGCSLAGQALMFLDLLMP